MFYKGLQRVLPCFIEVLTSVLQWFKEGLRRLYEGLNKDLTKA